MEAVRGREAGEGRTGEGERVRGRRREWEELTPDEEVVDVGDDDEDEDDA